MRITRALAGLVAAAAVLTTTTVPAEAAGSQAISRCSPDGPYGSALVITRNAHLTRNLTCDQGFVVASGATLDLRGHTLKALRDPDACFGSSCPGQITDRGGNRAWKNRTAPQCIGVVCRH